MMKSTITNSMLILIINLFSFGSLFAQQLDIQGTYDLKSLKKDSYLGHVDYDPSAGITTLTYVRKEPLAIIFNDYRFDSNLNFLEEVEDRQNIFDQMGDAIRELRYWFNYKGESFDVEGITVDPAWGGKLVARRYKTTYNYIWGLGTYIPTTKMLGTVKIEGMDDNRIYMYYRAQNRSTGEVLVLVGNKAPKGGEKYQHTMKYQFISISPDLKVTYGDEVNFEYAMCINFTQVVTDKYMDEEEEYDEIGDLANGNLAVVFSPMNNLFTKKINNPNPAAHTVVLVNSDAKIDARIDVNAPSSGWMIEDAVLFNDGEIILYGPSKDDKYINTLKPTNSPVTGNTTISETKWKSFQIMKIIDNKLAWIENTTLEEFDSKLITPPSQKRSPSYNGKKFIKQNIMLTPNKEFIITGQNFNLKKEVDKATGEETYYKIYTDLLMFHFDDKGKLKAQYGVRRDQMNKFSKSILTPQDIYMGADDNTLYWVYGELQGFRKGFNIDLGIQNVAIKKSKLLYYPTVAAVNTSKAKIGDFVTLGENEKGKQEYYTNPEFPQLLSGDRASLTFVGEDKQGKVIWLGRMNLK